MHIEQFKGNYRKRQIFFTFKKCNHNLKKIFLKYAALNGGKYTPVSSTSQLLVTDLIVMFKDSKLLDNKFITLPLIYAILQNVLPENSAKSESTLAPATTSHSNTTPSATVEEKEEEDAQESSPTAQSLLNASLNFLNFLEVLYALSLVLYPNPYKTEEERLKYFLEKDIMPFVSYALNKEKEEAKRREAANNAPTILF